MQQKLKLMEALQRRRSLATISLLLLSLSLGALFIAHTPWHPHVSLPPSWYDGMKKFYRVPMLESDSKSAADRD